MEKKVIIQFSFKKVTQGILESYDQCFSSIEINKCRQNQTKQI